jgi:glycosyltransferase involved in cell wall biosynthesis
VRIPVLITVRELDLGGIERDVARIAMGLDPLRFEPHVLTFRRGGLRFDELTKAAVPILHLPVGSLRKPSVAKLAFQLWRYMRKHKIQIAHSYDNTGPFVSIVAKAAGVPLVIASQLCHRSLLDRRSRRLLRVSNALADAILVNCKAVGEAMVEEAKVSPKRIELCYNGVDTAEFYSSQRSGTEVVVGTVCVQRPEKNLELLIDAFAQVRRQHDNVRLILVGSGEEAERLRARAAALNLSSSCEFVGATCDVASWMRKMTIFVLPSTSEAFSNAALEAMACGCAPICSRVGGMPELMGENGERGLMFESGNCRELAELIALLIRKPALRAEITDRALRYVRQNLTVTQFIRTTENMYERLLLVKKRG